MQFSASMVLAFDQAFIVFVIDLFRAFFGAHAAGDAFFHIHVARLLQNGDRKITFRSRNFRHLRQSEQLDIDVPADLDQFGRDNSHRAVVGGKGFIQLGHGPANSRRFFHYINIEPRIGKIQGRLHAGNTAADNHNGSLRRLSKFRRSHNCTPALIDGSESGSK
jgi:hypothetical protein